eukprot:TRINITY_DN5706_c0_g1_i1.p1 TRINITY_DN5706_c0_g1~~TRINITY_DN5706_c0_g1_i1.p1  ORF type:complete len:1047 (+),score=293.11 TRINITY_DN5706_c0_g1_i1:111-3251(+)
MAEQVTKLLADAERAIDEEDIADAEEAIQEALNLLGSARADSGGPGRADAIRMHALALASKGERRVALDSIAEELVDARSAGDKRAEGVLLCAQAEISNSRCGSKRRQQGYEAALQAQDIFKEIGDRRMEAYTLLALAHTHVQIGTKSEMPEELAVAVQDATSAQMLFRNLGEKLAEGKALHSIAVALSFQNNLDEAVARARELVQHWRDLGCLRLEAFQLECVSEWELARHRPEEALEAAQAALEKKKQKDAEREGHSRNQDTDHAGRSAAALIHASNAYLTLGKTDEALKLSQERLAYFRAKGNFESEIVAQSSVISVYVNEDRLAEAEEAAEDTLAKLRMQKQTRLLACWETDLLHTLTKIYMRSEKMDRAQDCIQQAMNLADDQKDKKALSSAWLLQSELSLMMAENRMGLKAAMKARDLARKSGSKKGEASALLQLCSAYCSRGELKRGAAVTVESQRIFTSVGDLEGEADALRMQAEVRLSLQDYPRAVAAARRCRELHREQGDRKSESWAAIHLAQILLNAASEEETQEMDRRKKAKEEQLREEGKEIPKDDSEYWGAQDWFQGDDQQLQERPAKAAFDRALQSAKDAHKLADSQNDDGLMCRALLSLATAQMMALEPEAAEKSLDQGLPLAERLGETVAEANFLLVKSQLLEYEGAHRKEEAKDHAQRALNTFHSCKDEQGVKAAERILKRLTPKAALGTRPDLQQGVGYSEDDYEEYWEEEVVEKWVPGEGGDSGGGGGGGGGAAVAEAYKGPSTEELQSVVSDIALSLIGVESLDADEPLMDAGLDSLAAVEFGNTISKEFAGVNLPSTLMFDYPSVKLLSGLIDAGLKEQFEQTQAKRIASAPAGGGGGGGGGKLEKTTRMVKRRRLKPGVQKMAGTARAIPRRAGAGPSEDDVGFGGFGTYQPPAMSRPRIEDEPSGGGYSGFSGFQQPQAPNAGSAPSAVAKNMPYAGPSPTEIIEMVKDTALSLIGVETLDDDEPLMDAGLDSLAAVEFGSAISKDFVGLEMPATLMFDYPSVKSLTAFIDTGLREAHAAGK